MKQAFWVFVGGGFGSVARYLLGKFLNSENSIPYGTMLANVLGSLLIGFVFGCMIKYNNLTQTHSLLLATGFCGGFTTFSAFAYENYMFLKTEDYFSFFIYMLATLALGIFAVFLGIYLAKTIF